MSFGLPNYTIPSDNRELQRLFSTRSSWMYYTIPSDNRELQPLEPQKKERDDYTIPSDNRELQQGLMMLT